MLTDGRSVEPVAASDHEEVADEAPVQPSLGSNDRVECHPSLVQLWGKRRPSATLARWSNKCWLSLSRVKGRLHSRSFSSIQLLTCATAPQLHCMCFVLLSLAQTLINSN